MRQDGFLDHRRINRLDHFGRDIAGADRIDGDAGPRAFLRQGLHKADIARLRGGVIHLAHLALLAVNGGNANDPPELAGAHAFPDRPRHVEQRVQVGVDDAVPLVFRHPVEHAVLGDAGIVDQHFNRADRRFHLGDACNAGVVVTDIPFERLDAGLLCESFRRRVISGITRRDLVAFRFEGLRNGRADAARTAGN